MAQFWDEFWSRRQNTSLSIRLAPVDNSVRALVSNYSSINMTPGMAFIDFGFLEPAMLAALQCVGHEGGTLPERLDGKLAVRVVMGYDAMNTLDQQLGRALGGFSASSRSAPPEVGQK